MKTNNILVAFNFETGEVSCPYWQVLTIVNKDNFEQETLEDCIMSYFDSEESEDKDFEDVVEDVLNSLNWDWEMVECKIPHSEFMVTIWI